jgi:hypothetical protein
VQYRGLRAAGYDFDDCDLGRVAQAKADQSQKQSSAALCWCLGPPCSDRSFGGHVVWKVARGGTRDRAERKPCRLKSETRDAQFLRLVEQAIPPERRIARPTMARVAGSKPCTSYIPPNPRHSAIFRFLISHGMLFAYERPLRARSGPFREVSLYRLPPVWAALLG